MVRVRGLWVLSEVRSGARRADASDRLDYGTRPMTVIRMCDPIGGGVHKEPVLAIRRAKGARPAHSLCLSRTAALPAVSSSKVKRDAIDGGI